MMMQASDPGPTDTHDWNDLRCFPSQGESDCIQAEGVTNDLPAKKPSQEHRLGPKEVHSTVLTKEEEAAVAAFRKYTLLPTG
jgi:hypothetical protein